MDAAPITIRVRRASRNTMKPRIQRSNAVKPRFQCVRQRTIFMINS